MSASGGLSLAKAVGDLSGRNFGLVIAYVIPGFIALWGLSWCSEAVRVWLQGTGTAGPSFGGALFVIVASIGCGLVLNAVRWATVDQVHHLTGLPHPHWDDSGLQKNLEAFDYLVENHFRYYQFYGASLVACVVAYAAWRVGGGVDTTGGAEFGVSLLVGVFLVSSRDALRKYYSGTSLLLGTLPEEPSHDKRKASSRTQGSKAHDGDDSGQAHA